MEKIKYKPLCNNRESRFFHVVVLIVYLIFFLMLIIALIVQYDNILFYLLLLYFIFIWGKLDFSTKIVEELEIDYCHNSINCRYHHFIFFTKKVNFSMSTVQYRYGYSYFRVSIRKKVLTIYDNKTKLKLANNLHNWRADTIKEIINELDFINEENPKTLLSEQYELNSNA